VDEGWMGQRGNATQYNRKIGLSEAKEVKVEVWRCRIVEVGAVQWDGSQCRSRRDV